MRHRLRCATDRDGIHEFLDEMPLSISSCMTLSHCKSLISAPSITSLSSIGPVPKLYQDFIVILMHSIPDTKQECLGKQDITL